MSTYLDLCGIVEKSIVANPTSNLYFLVDHGGLPGLYRQLSKTHVAWTNIFECTNESGALAAAPILILAASGSRLHVSRTLLEWLARYGTYSSTVNILSSSLQIEVIKRRLAMRLDVKLSGALNAMLRFFDPRVLESLSEILSAEQTEKFFSPVEKWRYVDRMGKLVEINTIFNPKENLLEPLSLTQKQEDALLEASDIDQVLNLLRSNLPNLMSRLSFPDQFTYVSQKIENARKIGLNSALKFSLYIIVLMLEGDDLIESTSSSNFLDKLSKDDFDFSEIFASSDLSYV